MNGGGGFAMANRSFGAESEFRIPRQSRQNATSRVARPRSDESRITDPRLIMIVRRANGLAKRTIDIFGALAGLAVLFPVFLTVALLIMLQDGGPPLFSHKRVGRYGRPFKCWKFRSMIRNGEALLRERLESDPDAAEEWLRTQKLTDDPRITRLGHFIRRSSIDELPQLWNVLVGEMSLVGPRPITRPELDRYGKERRYYLLVRPGLTGLWQVSGRSETAYEARIKLDREYVERWSFERDFMIILKTIPAVLAARGAS
jgi:exopolysaccharide production protein ExoY